MTGESSSSKSSKQEEQSQILKSEEKLYDEVMDSDMLKAQEFVISTEKGDTNRSHYSSLQTPPDQLHINL
jgi:hypothetical protein